MAAGTPISRSGGGALGLGAGGLGGVHGGGGHGVEVGFGDVGRLLDGLLHGFQGVVAGGNGALEHGDGGLGTGRGVLGGVVHDSQELLLDVGDLAFELLGELGTGGGADVVQVAAV